MKAVVEIASLSKQRFEMFKKSEFNLVRICTNKKYWTHPKRLSSQDHMDEIDYGYSVVLRICIEYWSYRKGILEDLPNLSIENSSTSKD